MKDDSSPTLLTIASVDDLFGAVPALLHFHPSESLVLVLVESGRVEVAARVDLARVRRRRSLCTALEPLLHRFPESDVLAIAYSGDGRAAWRVLELLRSEVGERCAVALHADGRRWYDSPDDVGRPYDPASTAVAAGAAYAGVEVRGSRAELAASLVGTFGRDEREAAMAEVATRWPEGPSREAAGDALLLSWRAGRSLTLHERCLLAVLAREPEWAERAILDTTRENAGDRFECWAQVAQASPGPMGRARSPCSRSPPGCGATARWPRSASSGWPSWATPTTGRGSSTWRARWRCILTCGRRCGPATWLWPNRSPSRPWAPNVSP